MTSIVSCGLCFFFKQKTAYDMRISDWSSDVCSSDLTGGCWHGGTVHVSLGCCRGQNPFSTPTLECLCFCRHRGGPGVPAPRGSSGRSGIPAMKIGRASCRERVCQYV